MQFISKQKFFNRYLPMFLSVLIIVAAAFAYLIFKPGTEVAQAAITPGTGTGSGLFSPTPESFSVTVAPGSNIALFVSTASGDGDGFATGCSYKGVAMTQLWNHQAPITNYYVAGYILINPATGSNTLQCTYSDNSGGAGIIWAQPFYGVSQAGGAGGSWRTPPTATDSGGGGSSAASITATTVSGDIVIDSINEYSTAMTVNASQSVQYQISSWDGSGEQLGVSTKVASSNSTTMQWTFPGTNFWAQGAVALIPARTGFYTQQGGKFRQRGGRVLVGGSPYYTPALVASTQTSQQGSTLVSTSTTTTAINFMNLIVVSCDYYHGGTAATSTVTDSVGNTYSNTSGGLMPSGGSNVWMFYAISSATNVADTITCNYGASSNYTSIAVSQYSGIAQTNPLDAVASSTSAGSNSVTSSAFTTVQPKEVIVAIAGVNTNVDFEAGANYTMRTSGSTYTDGIEDRITTSTQSGQVAVMSSSVFPNWEINVATFKAAHR